jgi:hypothetical protein
VTDLVEAARTILDEATAAEVAATYDDVPIFPFDLVVARRSDPDTSFPDWEGSILLLSRENQGVCTWGLALDGPEAGRVLVGGDLPAGVGTVVHAPTLDDFVASRRWDRACLDCTPLLQAQAEPLDEEALALVVDGFTEGLSTQGWPCDSSRRFERGTVRMLL